MTEQYQAVNFGVDSLWLNVCYGVGDDLEQITEARRPLEERIAEKLKDYQEMARQNEKPVPTDYEFDGACLLMYGNGGGLKSPWRFILRNHALELKVGTGKRNGIIARVRLLAEYLWREGDLRYCLYCAHAFLVAFFEEPVWIQVSRVDLCVDVAGYDFGKGDWQEGFIRRCGLSPHFSPDEVVSVEDDDENETEGDETGKASEGVMLVSGPDQVHMRYRPITGFSFGSRKSAMSAVVYNKSHYIKHKKPETVWFHDLWKKRGWDGSSEVWRIEFHLCREALHSMSIESAYQLPDRLSALWEYCTIQWLRYVVPAGDSNRSRWETHAVWLLVVGVYSQEATPEQLALGPVVRERKRVVNKQRMVAQITGCLITLHAWDKDSELCQDEDLSLVLHRYYENAEGYLSSKGREFNQEVRYRQRLYSLVAA
jgi:hypothetical protein